MLGATLVNSLTSSPSKNPLSLSLPLSLSFRFSQVKTAAKDVKK